MNNRVIKFRAWDGKEMRLSPDARHGLHGLATWFDAHSTFSLDGREKDSLIMQFTGLLDKNGKEIYEGDILKNPNKIPHWAIRWADENARYWMWYLQDSNGLYLDSRKAKTMKVIGNIYENPELISHV